MSYHPIVSIFIFNAPKCLPRVQFRYAQHWLCIANRSHSVVATWFPSFAICHCFSAYAKMIIFQNQTKKNDTNFAPIAHPSLGMRFALSIAHTHTRFVLVAITLSAVAVRVFAEVLCLQFVRHSMTLQYRRLRVQTDNAFLLILFFQAIICLLDGCCCCCRCSFFIFWSACHFPVVCTAHYYYEVYNTIQT